MNEIVAMNHELAYNLAYIHRGIQSEFPKLTEIIKKRSDDRNGRQTIKETTDEIHVLVLVFE
ncbi:hypothetical protein [Atopobacter phocae]|uniref:hypothetical protein n=1 Tax=Atopobacter phocae TaxID=136492 RepID=UPI00146FA17D|nr:hypothetical protein [Atopobacter phocae]